MSTRARLWLWRLLAVGWMGVIFWLSSRTGSQLHAIFPWVERWLPWLDGFNFGHFVAYFILSGLVWLALGAKDEVGAKVVVVLICLLYGVTDEYHQSFVPGRYPDWLDLRNDGIGAAAAMLLVSVPLVRSLVRRVLKA